MNRYPPISSASVAASALLGAALVLVGAAYSVSPVHADNLFVWAEEIGGDVIFRHQGSIDLEGFQGPAGFTPGSGVVPSGGAFTFREIISELYAPVIPDTTTMPFGSGGFTQADSSTGDALAVSETYIGFPLNYVSHTLISGSMTFLATTINDLGVNPTPYTIETLVGDNTIFMFTSPAEFAADLAELRKKIRKLKKKSKKLGKRGKIARARKLGKKVKELRRQLAALR